MLQANDIYKQAVNKWGDWSRQSFYSALNNEKFFKKTDTGYTIIENSSDDIDAVADKLADKSEIKTDVDVPSDVDGVQ